MNKKTKNLLLSLLGTFVGIVVALLFLFSTHRLSLSGDGLFLIACMVPGCLLGWFVAIVLIPRVREKRG